MCRKNEIDGKQSKQAYLVSPALLQAYPLRVLKVVLQHRLIVWVRALVDYDSRTFSRRQSTDVCQALFRNNNI